MGQCIMMKSTKPSELSDEECIKHARLGNDLIKYGLIIKIKEEETILICKSK